MSPKPKIVFIDDLDIILNIDKTFLSKILNLKKKLKNQDIQFVITSNINDDKKLQEHSKDLKIYKIYNPSIKDAFSYLCYKLDDISYEYDEENLLYLCQKFKGNIREIIINLSNTKYSIDETCVEKVFKDMNNFEIAKSVLKRNHSLTQLKSYLTGDTNMVPYVIYENLPEEIVTNYKVSEKDTKKPYSLIQLYSLTNEYYITASKMDDAAFRTIEWSLMQYSNLFRIGIILYVLSCLEKKQVYKDLQYKFSQMISRMSHKNILAKKIKTISSNTNFSKKSILTAADIKSKQTSINQHIEVQPQILLENMAIDNVKQECTSIYNTYDKYFK